MEGSAPEPVCIGLDQIRNGSADQWLDEAFCDNNALGLLLVCAMPTEFARVRQRVLHRAPAIASMCENRDNDWGISGLTRGGAVGDNLKASWYLSCNFLRDANADQCDSETASQFVSPFTSPNVWPSDNEVPGLREDVKTLVGYLHEAMLVVAAAIDRTYKLDLSVEKLIRESDMVRSRMTLYYPGSDKNQPEHEDYSLLTAFTGASGVGENIKPQKYCQIVRTLRNDVGFKPETPISIPSNAVCLKIGSTLEYLSQGRLRSSPHQFFGDSRLSIANFMLFGQPRLNFGFQNSMHYGEYMHDRLGKVLHDQKAQRAAGKPRAKHSNARDGVPSPESALDGDQ